MDFKDELRKYIDRIENVKDPLLTEEATKMSLIVPFFQLLGYDVFNPLEFCPEYTADIGRKRGEKVDYAILIGNNPVILIEAKSVNKKLDRHSSQLFRYFVSTPAKFAILTNGLEYRFYTDLDEPNKMDKDPFLEINLLNLKENEILQLSKFQKSALNISEILSSASLLKYTSMFKSYIDKQYKEPSDEFVKLFLQPVYKGAKTQSVIEKFRPIVSKALSEHLNELLSERIQAALDSTAATSKENLSVTVQTNEHWDILAEVKGILKGTLDTNKISLKHTSSYTAVLYEKNSRKWICRILSTSVQKFLIIPDSDKNEIRIPIEEISDLQKFSNQIIEVAQRYLLSPASKSKEKEVLHTLWGDYEMPDPYTIQLFRGPRADLVKLE